MVREGSNDYELLYMIYQMDEYSLKLFVLKYKKFILKFLHKTHMYSYLVHYVDDILAEGVKLLYQSIYAYRNDGCATFSTFYYSVLHNGLISFLYNKHCGLMINQGSALSLDKMVEDQMFLEDSLRNRNVTLEGAYYLEVDAYERSLRKILRYLHPSERQIIMLRIDGYSYIEIAKKLKIERKKVDNTIRKVRNIKV